MATHKIKADLDVDGEVQGTSLDINGDGNISGQLGINTAPAAGVELHVNGEIRVDGTDGVATRMIRSSYFSSGSDIEVRSGSSGDIILGDGTARLTLASNDTATFAGTIGSGAITSSGNVTLAGIVLDGNTITGVDDSGEFTDNDAHIMTSAGINDRFAQINANTTGSSGSCTGTAAQANNLQAFDDRDMAPEDLSYSDDLKLFFSAREGLEDGTSTGSDWHDVLVLNSYSDSSGGNANILAFDKSAYTIRHYQAGLSASNWGTAKTLAYTDSDISGNAATATSAAKLTDGGGISTHPGTSNLIYTGALGATVTGLFTASDNSNSILTVNRHSGDYNSQLGFSSNGNLYYRKFSGSDAYTTQGWKTIAFTDSDITGNAATATTAGTVTTAAQTNITSLGTLTTLTVDNVIINGTNIGHTSDTDLITLTSGKVDVAGELECSSLDVDGNADISGLSAFGSGTVGSAYSSDVILHTKGSSRSIIQQSSSSDAYYMFGDAGANNAAWVGYDHSNGTLSLQAQSAVTINKNTNVSGSVTATSLDINGNADISGNLTGLDNVTSTNFIIGGHTINDIDVTSEDSNADDHLMTAKAIVNLIADNENSFLTSSGNTSGTAAIATTITVADESSDTSCNVLFTTAATGNLGPKSGTNLTFNSSSGVLTATGFAGALTGNVTGNASGSSGSCTGNAASATEATSITATANNSANETVYLTFVDGATGTQGIETDTGLSYNPSTGALTTNSVLVGAGITHDGDINNKIAFTTDTQTFSCDGNESLILRGNAVTDEPLLEINGAGAGNQLNIGLLLKGVTDGNPIKIKMQAPNDSSSVTGAGILSYEPDADTFNIGQSTTHNSMAISINNDDIATFTNAATLSGGFVLDGNTITGVDNASEFTDNDNHIMTSTAIKNKIADNDNSFMLVSTTTTQTGTKTFSGVIDITNTTDSSNATGDTGALRCEGGGSIAKKLYVGSTITGSADVIAFSDKKLKENIETLDGKKVLDMRGVSFTRKDTGAESSGVIAQEIQKVAPELVHDTEGTLGVAYGNLVGYLIEAVKDQQKQINELKEIINGSSR